MNRRAFLHAAAAMLAGCDFSVADGLFNACAARTPERLRTHALVAAAWHGIDAHRVWDVHCHVFGNGDSGGGLWFSPGMERIWKPQQFLQRLFYLNAGCAHDAPGKVDASVVDRLLNQCEAMPPGFRALLFAFDWARDDAGRPVPERSTFHVPDDYAAGARRRAIRSTSNGRRRSIRTIRGRSIALDAAVARGARAVKWLPTAQGIDPASARCDRFYARLAALRLPLITHAGDERAVQAHGEDLGNPLKLRRPLGAGVRVVVAHCASLGVGRDLDRGGSAVAANFEMFARLMDDPQYGPTLAGDISAVDPGQPDGRRRHAARAPRLASAAAERFRLPAAGRRCRSCGCRRSSSAGCWPPPPWSR